MMRGLRKVRTEVVLEREREVRRNEGGKSARNSFILASSRRHHCVWPPETKNGRGEQRETEKMKEGKGTKKKKNGGRESDI